MNDTISKIVFICSTTHFVHRYFPLYKRVCIEVLYMIATLNVVSVWSPWCSATCPYIKRENLLDEDIIKHQKAISQACCMLLASMFRIS